VEDVSRFSHRYICLVKTEDCGGPHGYSTLLGIIANPDNKDYEEMITWLGGSFRPDLLNAGKVNLRLKPIQLC